MPGQVPLAGRRPGCFYSWACRNGMPRGPEIKPSFALSDGEFGLVLVPSSVGAIIGAQPSVTLVQKLDSCALLRMAQLPMPVGATMMVLAPDVWVPTIGLFFVGLGHAGMDIAANSQAIVIEKLIGKKFLASLHGAWSIGVFISALAGLAGRGLASK